MKQRTALLILLAGTLLVNAGAMVSATALTGAWWIAFLGFIPFVVGVFVWARRRWAAMACVLYGTVGLALDLATTVQIVTKDSDVVTPLLSSLISGALNFLLIVFGGRSFLDMGPVPPPQEARPPNPPSPV